MITTVWLGNLKFLTKTFTTADKLTEYGL